MNFNEKRFAFVDIETTGPNSKKDKVIGISAIAAIFLAAVILIIYLNLDFIRHFFNL